MKLVLSPSSVEDYKTFLKIKSLPRFRFTGRTAEFPDEYAERIGISQRIDAPAMDYQPSPFLFDYQRDITQMAINKKKFAIFADPGLGKTLIYFEWMRHVARLLPGGKRVLFLCPLMVVNQTIDEVAKFYGMTMPMERIRARNLQSWLDSGRESIGICNYEALSNVERHGELGALVCDESSIMKSHYGVWGQKIIELGAGLEYKVAGTGTPAPNDRIEYANHAIYLDRYPTVNSFLARFFVNRGRTENRWELKPHALRPFYRALSDWCIFLSNPATYGWKDNVGTLPPIKINIYDVALTTEQRELSLEKTGKLFASDLGGIVGRSAMGQIAKGNYQGKDIASNKPAFIKSLVDSFKGESTIIWCIYNEEQAAIEKLFPEAASIKGTTSESKREQLVSEFKCGKRKQLISKGKILGLGLNFQNALHHVFSGLQDSYETYWQCIKRSNRIGSTQALNVHIPTTEIERPMIDTVLRKAHRVEQDTAEQEAIFAGQLRRAA